MKATVDAALARGGRPDRPFGGTDRGMEAKAFGGFGPRPGGPGTPAYFELPYGRLAAVADPTGARFKIVGLGHH